MAPLGLEASYYGHAAAGLLHVRPVLDLHSAEGVKKFRRLASEVSALVSQFTSTLDREQRGQQMTQMAGVFGEDLPAISLLFPPLVWAHAASLRGPHEGPGRACGD